MKWIIFIALTALSGWFYRLGGMGDDGRKEYNYAPKWLFNTKARDIGCALCGWLFMIIFFNNPWWAHLAGGVMLFGSLTTYWDTVFGFDNHWFHGFMCALAYFPYAIANVGWVGFGVRCIALAISMGLVSTLSEDDDVEEVGRGAFLILTLPLLFI